MKCPNPKDDRRRKWIIRYRNNPGVKLWLQSNAPPDCNQMEYAYRHMPLCFISTVGMKARDVRKRRKALTI